MCTARRDIARELPAKGTDEIIAARVMRNALLRPGKCAPEADLARYSLFQRWNGRQRGTGRPAVSRSRMFVWNSARPRPRLLRTL
jgi:hypothetical protein